MNAEIHDHHPLAHKGNKHNAIDMQPGYADDVQDVSRLTRSALGQDSPAKQFPPRRGIKKSNFTREQAAILRQWFIKHADNPYIKEDSKRMLA